MIGQSPLFSITPIVPYLLEKLMEQQLSERMSDMEEQTFETWESRIKEQLAEADVDQLLDLTQDTVIRLACSIGDAKASQRIGASVDCFLVDELKRRVARVAVLMDVMQLRYGDAAEEEETFLKDIEKCLE